MLCFYLKNSFFIMQIYFIILMQGRFSPLSHRQESFVHLLILQPAVCSLIDPPTSCFKPDFKPTLSQFILKIHFSNLKICTWHIHSFSDSLVKHRNVFFCRWFQLVARRKFNGISFCKKLKIKKIGTDHSAQVTIV